MSKRIRPLCGCILLAAVAASAQSSPGHVNYQALGAGGYLDSYVSNPNYNQWFLDHFMRFVEYSRFFDSNTAWYPRANVYIDSYAIYQGKDANGQPTGTVNWDL